MLGAVMPVRLFNRLGARSLLALVTVTGLLGCLAESGPRTRGIEFNQQAGVPAVAATTAVVASAPVTRDTPRIQIETGSHAAPVRAIAISPDQSLVVTASDDKTGRIWDATTGQLRSVLRAEIGDDEMGRLYAVAIHPTDDLVALAGTTASGRGNHKILLFRASNGEFVRAFDALAGDIKKLAFTPGGILLATYDGGHGLRAFAADGRQVFADRYAAPSYGLAVSADGRHAAATSLDNTVYLYAINGQQVQQRLRFKTSLPRPRDVAFSPAADRLAVAYVGQAGKQPAPTIFDASSGRVIRQLARPALKAGNLRTMVWSAADNTIYAGGSGYQQVGEHSVFAYAPDTGRLTSSTLTARNSITDMVSTRSGNVLYASFDGSWGRLDQGNVARQIGGDVADLRGPKQLRISDSGKQVAFRFAFNGQPAWFDLDKRVLTVGNPPGGLKAPPTSGGWSDKWENVRRPVINGAQIAVRGVEVSRSVAYLKASRHALHGTSLALRRIGPNGQVVWRQPTNAEVWAINVTRDERVAVVALSDGTIRWHRADDGQLLMTLLMKPDGRWATWSPQGYFDASEGADRMIGWSVNRSDEPVADFFSLNRFREQFNRPDIIDHLVDAADIAAAIQLAQAANQEFARQASVSLASLTAPQPTAAVQTNNADAAAAAATVPAAPASPPVQTAPAGGAASMPAAAAPASAPLTPAPAKSVLTINDIVFPPVLRRHGAPVVSAEKQDVTIPFGVKAQSKPEIEVRVNGKVHEQARIEFPARFDGKSRAIAMIPAPDPGAIIHVIARDNNGVSEPLGFRLEVPPRSAVKSASALPPVPNVISPVLVNPSSLDAALTVAAPDRQVDPDAAATGLDRVLTSTRLPNLYVLSIGISAYQNPAYALGLPAKDARDFMSTIVQQRGRLYGQVQTRLLDDTKASRAAVLEGLQWLRSSVGPKDTGILFLAGHGLNSPSGAYYFMPWDANHQNLDQTAVPETAIRQTLSAMRGRTLFFVDTCHAGEVGTFRQARRELRKLANDLAATENGVIVFASSSGRQLSEERDEWGNGAFTKAVIEGLQGRADFRNTGRVTFKSLDFYVSEEVARLTEGRQTPVTNIPVGIPDFALASLGGS